MARQSTYTISSDDEAIAKSVLTDWLEATADFHYRYNVLMQLINDQQVMDPLSQDNTVDRVDSPANKLIPLTLTMRGELEKLVYDLDQLDCLNQNSTKQNYEKLIAHTQILTRLSRQAQIKIQFVGN